ncbi:MAG: zinc ribbon domain-containing protein [Prevotella sp.]|nr:zinc ribbon domain-containing protein [Prevotella sp.]
MRQIEYFLMIIVVMLVTACYNRGPLTSDAWDLTERQLDSISFFTTHHYTQNYNFVVNAESLPLSDQPGEMAFDTLYVAEGERLVVADIQTIPTDSVDSVWVKVARDQMTQGWIRESEMLEGVSPDDPISQFIDYFSNTHLLVFLAFLVVMLVAYGLYLLNRHNAPIVHFNDIDSFYPTLLCLLVASSATLYASIQLFGAESWRHFYYHPSLNPFTLPLHLAMFVASVWAIIIVAVAAFDDVLRHLSGADALLYLGGLAGVCAIDYVVFSVSTLYYIGYPLLIVYVTFALRCYIHTTHSRYLCGKCGAPLSKKGRCPNCGALNT